MKLTIERLVRAAKTLTALANDIAIPRDMQPPLTPGELTVLSILVGRGDAISISELVGQSQLAQSRVSSVVRGLKTRGWVEITTPEHDRRSTLVHATKAVMRSARRVVRAEIGWKFAGRLPEASAAELKAILGGIDALLLVLDRRAAPAARKRRAP